MASCKQLSITLPFSLVTELEARVPRDGDAPRPRSFSKVVAEELNSYYEALEAVYWELEELFTRREMRLILDACSTLTWGTGSIRTSLPRLVADHVARESPQRDLALKWGVSSVDLEQKFSKLSSLAHLALLDFVRRHQALAQGSRSTQNQARLVQRFRD